MSTTTTSAEPARGLGAAPGNPMIQLKDVTKRYGDDPVPAVDDITLDVPEGEIVILVGPSGCGKTTTMKMMNRLIEPSEGKIILEGEDVTGIKADELRRRIGYVIQAVGLFPHQTIAQNVATVPRLLGWDKKRTAERVDELLDLVALDPARYRDRYPKELSGGQRQRVGVVRGLAADPPVMLMDEPFGAIDPINRDKLQNEFLRLQSEIRKTIVFVTHDIDEAIKMGDRICILREGGVIAQYDTPENILSNPVDDFVADFVGSSAGLKRLGLARVRDYELADDWPVARVDEDGEALFRRLSDSRRNALLLLDERRHPLRWITSKELHAGGDLRTAGQGVATVEPDADLATALDQMIRSRVGTAVVVDGRGAYRGVLDFGTVTAAAETMRRAAHERADEAERAERVAHSPEGVVSSRRAS